MTDLNTNEEKLGWIFTAFDQDGGGYIDVDEIRDIVTCLFRLTQLRIEGFLESCCVLDLLKWRRMENCCKLVLRT